jgi:hypothetical protein
MRPAGILQLVLLLLFLALLLPKLLLFLVSLLFIHVLVCARCSCQGVPLPQLCMLLWRQASVSELLPELC